MRMPNNGPFQAAPALYSSRSSAHNSSDCWRNCSALLGCIGSNCLPRYNHAAVLLDSADCDVCAEYPPHAQKSGQHSCCATPGSVALPTGRVEQFYQLTAASGGYGCPNPSLAAIAAAQRGG